MSARRPPRGPDPVRARRALMRWFSTHARRFFWREGLGGIPLTRFQVLLVEFLLWKTSARAAPVIQEIVLKHPDPATVARRTRRQLERDLRPLGLHRRRAACLKALAKELVEIHGGEVPADPRELMRLTGIGQYASRATACLLAGSRLMPVDANTTRVFGRLYGEPGPGHRVPGPTWDARFDAFVPARQPRRFVWAVMDLSATTCTPREPRCPSCPLRRDCATAS